MSGFGYSGGPGGTGDVSQEELNEVQNNVTLNAWHMQLQTGADALPQQDGIVDYFVDETDVDTGNTTLDYNAAGDYYENPSPFVSGGYDFNLDMAQTNGSTTFDDLSQNDLTTTGYGGVDFETDPADGAITTGLVSRENGYLYTDDNAVLDIGSDDVIFDMRVRLKDLTNTNYLASRFENSINKKSYMLYVNTTGDVLFLASADGTNNGTTQTFDTNLVVDTWYDIRLEYDRSESTLELFINGVSNESKTFSENFLSTDTGLTICNRRTGSGTTIATHEPMDITRFEMYVGPTVVTDASPSPTFQIDMTKPARSTNFEDSSGTGVGITAFGSISFGWLGGYNGNATSIVLDGSTQYVATADLAAFDLGTNDIILEIAFNQDVTTGTQNLMSRWEGSTKKSIALNANAGDLDWYVSSDGSTGGTATKLATGVFTAGNWYHVLVIYDRARDQVRTYINGVYKGAVSETRTPFATDIGWAIGARRTGSGDNADQFLDGKIGLAKILSGDAAYEGTADTDSIVKGEDFVLDCTGNADASTTFSDLSLNNSTVTAVNGASWSNDASPYSTDHATSCNLTRTGDEHLEIDNGFFDNTGDLTFEFVVSFNDNTATHVLASQDDEATAGTQRAFSLYISSSLGNISFIRSSGGTSWNDTAILITGLGLSVDTWYHLRMTYENATGWFKVYIDGALAGSFDGTDSFSMFDSSAPIRVGRRGASIDANYKLAGCKITNGIVEPTMLSNYETLKTFPVDNDTNYHFVLDMAQTEGSTTFADLSANNTTVTATGTLAFTRAGGTYAPNSAYVSLDGTDDSVLIDEANFDGSGDLTFEIVARFKDTTNQGLFEQDDQSTDRGFTMYLDSSLDRINFLRSSGGTAWNDTGHIIAGLGLEAGPWYHLRITYDQSEDFLRVYVNGDLTVSRDGTNVFALFDSTQNIVVGELNGDFATMDVAAVRLANSIQEPVFFTDPFTDLSVSDGDVNGNVQTQPQLADSAPSEIRLMALIQTDGTLNTDVIGEVSRDGGTTWTQATLEATVTFSGAVNCITADPVTVTGQPIDTSIVGRIRSINDATTEVHGISLGW